MKKLSYTALSSFVFGVIQILIGVYVISWFLSVYNASMNAVGDSDLVFYYVNSSVGAFILPPMIYWLPGVVSFWLAVISVPRFRQGSTYGKGLSIWGLVLTFVGLLFTLGNYHITELMGAKSLEGFITGSGLIPLIIIGIILGVIVVASFYLCSRPLVLENGGHKVDDLEGSPVESGGLSKKIYRHSRKTFLKTKTGEKTEDHLFVVDSGDNETGTVNPVEDRDYKNTSTSSLEIVAPNDIEEAHTPPKFTPAPKPVVIEETIPGLEETEVKPEKTLPNNIFHTDTGITVKTNNDKNPPRL